MAKQIFTVNALASQSTQEPLIQISGPDLPPCCEEETNTKRLKVRSNTLGPHEQPDTTTENRPPWSALQIQNSDGSLLMSTAPESPKHYIKVNSTVIDVPRLPAIDVRDFALGSTGRRTSTAAKAPSHAGEAISPLSVIPRDAPPNTESTRQINTDSQIVDVNPPCLEFLGEGDIEGMVKKGNPAVILVDGLDVATSKLPVPAGVPMEATGELPAPETPKPTKSERAISKGKKVLRRGRRVVLRKPVLAMVVGRQLSGPTSTALKLISKGASLEILSETPLGSSAAALLPM